LLPSLLFLLRHRPRNVRVGYARLAPLESSFIGTSGVLGLGGIAAIASAALLPLVRFDFDPLHLRVQGGVDDDLRDLTSDPG